MSNTEPLRHIDKTRQDKLPVSERQRVKDWHNRITNMKLHAGHTLTITEDAE